jgi:hypothetical protein
MLDKRRVRLDGPERRVALLPASLWPVRRSAQSHSALADSRAGGVGKPSDATDGRATTPGDAAAHNPTPPNPTQPHPTQPRPNQHSSPQRANERLANRKRPNRRAFSKHKHKHRHKHRHKRKRKREHKHKRAQRRRASSSSTRSRSPITSCAPPAVRTRSMGYSRGTHRVLPPRGPPRGTLRVLKGVPTSRWRRVRSRTGYPEYSPGCSADTQWVLECSHNWVLECSHIWVLENSPNWVLEYSHDGVLEYSHPPADGRRARCCRRSTRRCRTSRAAA